MLYRVIREVVKGDTDCSHGLMPGNTCPVEMENQAPGTAICKTDDGRYPQSASREDRACDKTTAPGFIRPCQMLV